MRRPRPLAAGAAQTAEETNGGLAAPVPRRRYRTSTQKLTFVLKLLGLITARQMRHALGRPCWAGLRLLRGTWGAGPAIGYHRRAHLCFWFRRDGTDYGVEHLRVGYGHYGAASVKAHVGDPDIGHDPVECAA